MSLKLVSDFEDYYDQAFSPEGTPFVRTSKDVRTRAEILLALERYGLRIPLHGPVHKVIQRLSKEWLQDQFCPRQSQVSTSDQFCQLFSVIVYDDILQPRSGPKRLMTAGQAMSFAADSYCVEFVVPPRPNLSWRYIQIGRRRFWVESESLSHWRSTMGESQTVLLSEDVPYFHPRFMFPLYSIDFIPGRHLYAFDFQLNPTIAGTGIDAVLRPSEVVALLEEATQHFRQSESYLT